MASMMLCYNYFRGVSISNMQGDWIAPQHLLFFLFLFVLFFLFHFKGYLVLSVVVLSLFSNLYLFLY